MNLRVRSIFIYIIDPRKSAMQRSRRNRVVTFSYTGLDLARIVLVHCRGFARDRAMRSHFCPNLDWICDVVSISSTAKNRVAFRPAPYRMARSALAGIPVNHVPICRAACFVCAHRNVESSQSAIHGRCCLRYHATLAFRPRNGRFSHGHNRCDPDGNTCDRRRPE